MTLKTGSRSNVCFLSPLLSPHDRTLSHRIPSPPCLLTQMRNLDLSFLPKCRNVIQIRTPIHMLPSWNSNIHANLKEVSQRPRGSCLFRNITKRTNNCSDCRRCNNTGCFFVRCSTFAVTGCLRRVGEKGSRRVQDAYLA